MSLNPKVELFGFVFKLCYLHVATVREHRFFVL